ncbi:MAG TPA: tetratricopeptide repeat protein [Blastocatellia bacterium]|nr:tetratricopeptide repeat protein [Blastocatellia bacterium]
MLPQFFLKTKLLPPRLGRRVLARPRLVERIRGFLDQPATIVCADAGCGKTTLVTEFARSLGLPFVWYQIDPTDVDLAVFFGYLAYGIRALHPNFGQVFLRFISETEALTSKIDQLVDVLVNEVSEQIEQKTIVVLDDYHHVDSSTPIAVAIDRVLQYIPDVLHIIITSRTMPNLSVTRLRSKGLVGVIDRKDLLFTPAEVQKLFAETFHQPLAPDQLDQFYEKTDGWVTGLQLIQQSLDHSNADQSANIAAGTRLTAAFQQSELDIFDYFAEEVLQAESPDTRLMLGKLSLLERIDPSICEAALGILDCADQLRLLARRNVFLSQTYASGTDEEYRLHPLFRSFLKRWLATELDAEALVALHKECSARFAAAAQWDLAVNHLAQAGAADAVADLLAEHGSELVQSGRLETVKLTFDQLSEPSLNGRPRALIARADVALIEGDHSRALGLYARAARMARDSQDHSQEQSIEVIEAEALRGQAYIARYGSDCELATRLATSAIEIAPRNLHALRARCYNTIGLCCFRSGQSERAIENWQAALKEAREAGDDRFARIALHNLGLPYSIEGDFNEAIRWLGQMIDHRNSKEASGGEPVPFPQEAIAHLNIARLEIVQGKLDEAELHLGSALERCQMFNLKSWMGDTLEAFGNLYRERGDYNRALDFYAEAARAYSEAGISLSDRELLDEKATLYLRMGDLVAAAREAEDDFRGRGNGTPSERSTTLITRGRIQTSAGQTVEAEATLIEAATIAGDNKLRYNEARAALSLALLYWEQGRSEAALARLRRAVELAVRYDYAYLFSLQAAASPALFRAAIEAGIAPDYLAQILPRPEQNKIGQIQKVLGAEVAIATAAAAGATESNSVTVAPFIPVVVERASFDLAINMLGPVEVFRDPAGMAKEAWRLSKSLHILCYLGSRRNHRAPKETLVDLFWGDVDEDTVAKNFHPTISHMRKALNTGQVVKRDFVLYREGAYSLNPQYRYRLDTEEFERLLGEAREARRTGGTDRSDRDGAAGRTGGGDSSAGRSIGADSSTGRTRGADSSTGRRSGANKWAGRSGDSSTGWRSGADESARLLAEAIKLYRGDFLEEFYYNWIGDLQSYYRDLYLEALKELISYHAERASANTDDTDRPGSADRSDRHKDQELVIRYGQMLLTRDAYQEDVHCSVMEAFVQSGNRAAAIEQFDGLRKMLRRELGVDPLPATIAKYEALIK